MVPNGTTRALRCSSSISYTTTTNYESLCSSHAHPLGAGAANMTLRSPLSAWTFAFVLCLSLLLMPLVLKCLQHRSVVRMPAGVNTGNSRRAPELRLRWDEVGERVKLEQILGARCRYGIDRGLRVMHGGPTGQSVSDCGVRDREE